MSFFGGAGMFNDPLFGDPGGMMRNQLQQMDSIMNSMMLGQDPLSAMFNPHPVAMNALVAPRAHMMHPFGVAPMLNPLVHPGAMMPLGGGGLIGPGGGFGGLFQQLEGLQTGALQDPSANMMTHSEVISINNLGAQRPQVYHATNSVRRAGDVKEVRRTVRDSDKGLEKMSVAHHIGERGHVIEKERSRGGEITENQEFINIDEEEAREFDSEFGHRANRNVVRGLGFSERPGPSSERLAIEGRPRRADRGDRDSPYRRSDRKDRKPATDRTSTTTTTSSGEYHGPIIEEIE